LRHFLLFSGYVTMEVLVVAFLSSFQTDVIHPLWHPTRVFGYYATVVLMIISAEMMISRYKKTEDLHRYSDFTDWFFLILLFLTAFSGILVHFFRLAGWPLMTYSTYVVHLSIAVGMLCVMLPFGKLSHLLYRPLAIFLSTVSEKASTATKVELADVEAEIGEIFLSCMQCGTCTSVCPWNQVISYSPRRILRQLALETGSEESVDLAVWNCVTCNACGVNCPRGIEIIDVIKAVRGLNVTGGRIPEFLTAPLDSLKANGNPWNGVREQRLEWATGLRLPTFSYEHEYCLFSCCTTAYDPTNRKAGRSLVQLLEYADIAYGTLGPEEICCGDPAHHIGAVDIYSGLARKNTTLFMRAGVHKILTTSPHCLNAFKKNYAELKSAVASEHYTELLDRLVGEGRLKPLHKVVRTVTYHDPCYLGRHNGIYDEPRRVLESIPGLTVVEMTNNRENSLCCGGGGGGAWCDNPRSQGLGVLRVEEALNTGAEVVVTACPYCSRMLNAAVQELDVSNQIAAQDLAEILLQSVMMRVEAHIVEPVALESNLEVCHA
jgi:Fe-S oxidoreductase